MDEIHKLKNWRNYLKGIYDSRDRHHKATLVTGSAKLDFYRKCGDSLQVRYFHYRLHPHGTVRAVRDLGCRWHAPYTAAVNCEALNENGHTDWYLPAYNELGVLYSGRSAIGNFIFAGNTAYWSSTESSSGAANYVRFSDGLFGALVKNTNANIRCVRR
ncbi:MAG: DUF1566 domain-containing protein [Bdellovibrionota bacterium]